MYSKSAITKTVRIWLLGILWFGATGHLYNIYINNIEITWNKWLIYNKKYYLFMCHVICVPIFLMIAVAVIGHGKCITMDSSHCLHWDLYKGLCKWIRIKLVVKIQKDNCLGNQIFSNFWALLEKMNICNVCYIPFYVLWACCRCNC